MKRILITGAASGLGLAMAKKYASEGWSVCVADIQDQAGEQVAQKLKKEYGNDSFFQHLDVTNESQWQETANLILQRWQGLDGLINNAGVAAGGDIDTLPLKDFQWAVDINLMGVVKGCYYCVPLLKQSQGVLINVASMAGLLHMTGMSAYNASKAAVVALSETLLSELDPYEVNVSVVCPAFFQTNLLGTMRCSSEGGVTVASKLMASSNITADDIAKQVFDQSAQGKHIILTHKREKLMWRIKRYLPALYFSLMKKMANKFYDKEMEKQA